MSTRVHILVRGTVQGVGFRPFVFSQAHLRALRGRVQNNTSGVLIDVEGESKAIDQLIHEIESNPPPLSTVESVERSLNLSPANYSDFRIIESVAEGEKFVPISADVAVCDDCLREMLDPNDRRYRYPFINCTNCGPRFTIIEGIPYDRGLTTMRDFPVCDACRNEYENSLDRRFHAEPTACFACGPRLSLADSEGREVALDSFFGEEALAGARRLLLEGKIVAVKGVGGFHLACDALNRDAVERLRRRKVREDKPFAMMASSVGLVRQYCAVSEVEERLLSSERRPIVLLEKRPGPGLPEALARGATSLGFMLPYSPLHHLLLEGLDRPLVMTSGNVSDEPICHEDADAVRRLNGIADYFLLHNRRIHVRSDDSVTRAFAGKEMILRRSRGYAPAPIKVALKGRREVLACGAELKNTFCLTREDYAFVSHHIGDLENLETLRSFTQGIEHFKRLFDLRPEVVAYDLHPEYLSTKYALSLDEVETKVGVQHHHAHIASCMADSGLEGEVIGVAMDGLGFGSDGRFWGGEFFVADFLDAERIAHLDYVPMPGGAKAIREPWRMAAVYLRRALGDEFLGLDIPFVRELDRGKWSALRSMCESGTNSPGTSSMGRLFDALSGLLTLRGAVNYEGQAAIELEAVADPACSDTYDFEVAENGSIIKADPVIRCAVDDLLGGVSPGVVSAKFHLGVAGLIRSLAVRLRDERRLGRVVLSGGVFQNMFLLSRVCRMLRQDGFEVFTHSRVPPNDGGISLGQAAIAAAHLASGRI
ncbi:MAG TPA: carbamoyltransferase HypF [Blastocatellia bacterium]|nr:carbamoyltransferase HypF [Blastocatellia bacterium]